MGILAILTIIFVILKETEVGTVATWSWWWVLSPVWIELSIYLVIFLIVMLVNVLKSTGKSNHLW